MKSQASCQVQSMVYMKSQAFYFIQLRVYMRSPWLMSQYSCIQYISIYNLKSALQTQIYCKYKSIIFILYYIFIIFIFYCVKMPYNVRWYLNTLRKVRVHINCLRIKNKCLQSRWRSSKHWDDRLIDYWFKFSLLFILSFFHRYAFLFSSV